MTTLLDVMVKPYCAHYLRQAEARIKRSNEDCAFLIMQSNGGVTTAEKAADKPVTMLLSGPAAGVLGAVHMASLAGFSDILTFDVGGTSTDVCVVRDGRPILTSDTVIEGYPVKVPMIDMATVGTGGGSIAWIDPQGFLKVGPASAGAVPGPISYGRGGQQPTVTDAALVLGRLPEALIGGELALQPDLARRAFEALGARLNLSMEEAAAGVLEIAAANQVHGIRRVTVHKGIDPSTYCLVAFGGAGGMLATDVADFLGSPTILSPPNPGNLSAFGLQVSDIRRDLVRTFVRREAAGGAGTDDIVAAWKDLAAAGREELRAQGVADSGTSILLGADLRYAGQSYEVRVMFAADCGPDEAAGQMWARFHQAHNREFGYSYPGEQEVELVNLRAQAVGHIYRPAVGMQSALSPFPPAPGEVGEIAAPGEASGGDRPGRPATRRTYWRGQGWIDCAIIDRATLQPGQQFVGPVIVQEYGSTVVVPGGWLAVCDDSYNIVIDRQPL
jgi:N-methylhydantoinase A